MTLPLFKNPHQSTCKRIIAQISQRGTSLLSSEKMTTISRTLFSFLLVMQWLCWLAISKPLILWSTTNAQMYYSQMLWFYRKKRVNRMVSQFCMYVNRAAFAHVKVSPFQKHSTTKNACRD